MVVNLLSKKNINSDRSRIKVFKAFEDLTKPIPNIDVLKITYGFVYKLASKKVITSIGWNLLRMQRKNVRNL